MPQEVSFMHRLRHAPHHFVAILLITLVLLTSPGPAAEPFCPSRLTEAPALVHAYEANLQRHAAHSHPYRRAAAPTPATTAGEVHGNRKSKVYRVPGCKGFSSMTPASLVPFATEAAAQQAGYRRAK